MKQNSSIVQRMASAPPLLRMLTLARLRCAEWLHCPPAKANHVGRTLGAVEP